MFRSSKVTQRKSINGWQGFLCLALLAFFCRSAIPTGYMPTLSAGKGVAVALTLCTAHGGTQTLLLDLQSKNNEPAENAPANQACPFGLVMSHGVLPVQALLILTTTVWQQRPVLVAERNRSLPPLPALGPPLGSRAPPVRLG